MKERIGSRGWKVLFFKSPDKCQDFIILKEYKSNLEEILMLDKYISKKEYLSLYKDNKDIRNRKCFRTMV